MASETDPLLPRGNSAPEITGDGFSKGSDTDYQYKNEARPVLEREDIVEETGDEPFDEVETFASPLRTICYLFFMIVLFALFIAFLIPKGLRDRWQGPGDNPLPHPQTVEARVNKILSENPLIDGHNDLAIMIRYIYHNEIYGKNFTDVFENGGMVFHVDLPRLKAGKVGGAFWSAFMGCPANGSDFSDEAYAPVITATLSQLDLLRRLTAAYPTHFSSPNINSTTALPAFSTKSLLISPLAVEGLHQIGNSLSLLRLYHSLSVRYATLTHNCHNPFADAALITNSTGTLIAAPPLHGGVSPRGRLAVKEMNRLGMLVDISHVSEDTMLDVLGGRPEKWIGSQAPVIFSHSSAYALCPHPRNVPDDVLDLVKTTNSIVMVNFSPDFISCTPSTSSTGIPEFYSPNSTLHQVARHIMYIGQRIGFEHVGLGSDFDGILETPKGLDDVSKYPDLIAELLRMGLTDTEAAKVVGRNVLRVWGDADRVAEKMQAAGVLPVEDELGDLFVEDLM